MDPEYDRSLAAEGFAALNVTEDGETEEVGSPVSITLDRSCVWRGRPDREPVVSDDLAVRRFVRKAVYSMRPNPTPRPVTPAPKPGGGKKAKGQARAVDVPCPACSGTGVTYRDGAARVVDCEVCDGSGVTPPERAEAWKFLHG